MTSRQVLEELEVPMTPDLDLDEARHSSAVLPPLGSQPMNNNGNGHEQEPDSDSRLRAAMSFSSPDESQSQTQDLRKRKVDVTMSVDRDSPSPKRGILSIGEDLSLHQSSIEFDSSEEDEFHSELVVGRAGARRRGPEAPGGGAGGASGMKAGSRRQLFSRSKSSKHNYSMPVIPSSNPNHLAPNQQNRRASLPHNLKIPQITITPSSPSPDPNHPDYPEFFEDKLYLESKNMSTSSESSSAVAAAAGTGAPARPPMSKEPSACRSEMDVDEAVGVQSVVMGSPASESGSLSLKLSQGSPATPSPVASPMKAGDRDSVELIEVSAS